MKKLLILLAAALYIASVQAQVAPPRAFSYKATIISKSGAVIALRTVGLRISIMKNSAEGIAVYSEVFYPKTSEYGQVDILIGKGTVLLGNFELIDWSAGEYFLKTEVDVKGGTDFVLMSTVQLLSVPYSLFTDKANHAFSADEKDPLFSQHPSSSITSGDINTWHTAAGWGDHSLAGYVPYDSVYTKSDFRLDGRLQISWSNLSEHPSKSITADDLSRWNTAFSWGDHSKAGYAISDSVYTKSELQLAGRSEVNWENLGNRPEFATVATTGKYSDLQNLPEIPDNLNQLTPDAGKRTITNVARPVNPGDAATKAYVDALIDRITALEKVSGIVHIERDSVQDNQGNTYKTVKIGNQWWMAENLKSTRFNNGEPIIRVADNAAWSNLNIGSAYCYYNNDSSSFAKTYGALYNWYAVNDPRNICPAGWHVPSDGEWTTLSDFAGGDAIAGGKLKEKDLVHWSVQNTGATDDFGFTGLPGGTRNLNGTYSGIGTMGHFWTITEVDGPSALFRRMTNTAPTFYLTRSTKTLGTSVRCIKGESAPSTFAVVTTDSVKNITASGAISGGNVISDSGDKVTARGICWSSGPNPIITGAKTIDSSGIGRFTSNIINLAAGRKFYVRAYATNSAGTAYGNEISFTTSPGLASLTVFDAASVTTTSAVCSGAVSYDGGSAVTAKGICWGQVSLPTIENDTTNEGSGSGAFVSNLTGLEPGSSYTFRPYAINSIGVAYGPARSFRTLDLPAGVRTDSVVVKMATGAVVVGTFTGPVEGTEHGVCWSLSPNPTPSENKLIISLGAGSYNLFIRDLEPSTTYYARPYVISGSDTIYSEQVSFTTFPESAPILRIVRIDNVSSETATIVTSFANDGGHPLTTWGICWSLSPEPDTTNNKINFSNNNTYLISGLTPGTRYYVRGYAVNSLGLGYGEVSNFTTAFKEGIIVVHTGEASVNSSIVSVEGDIEYDGGIKVTERGICWNSTGNPTILENRIPNGADTGRYVCNISGLTPGTTYYARAYAINPSDTAYANEVSFTTGTAAVKIKTDSITSIKSNSAIIRGTYTPSPSDVEFGVCWNTSPSPTVNDHKISGNPETGLYQLEITGLNPNTTYYARSYVVSSTDVISMNALTASVYESTIASLDTIYGNEVSFQTAAEEQPGIPRDPDGNTYTTVTIGSQTWLKENLKTTKYANGDPIPNITGSEWSTQASGAYCWYNNDTINKNIYGALYNWYAVTDPRNICPAGWHEPTNGEWTILIMQLGGETVAGGKLKEAGLSHWLTPNAGATNESGFTALPGGRRDPAGVFSTSGVNGPLWSSIQVDSASAYIMTLSNSNPVGSVSRYPKAMGLAIRCIKGDSAPLNLPEVTTTAVTNVTSTGATTGGTVISDGGETVVSRGVCYSNIRNPNITQGRIFNDDGLGEFTVNIANQQPGRTIYVRAFATNAAGTAYGNELSFTTLPGLASVSTGTISAITENSANIAASVSWEGGSPVKERGVCWSIVNPPTITDNKISSGQGIGNYTASLSGLDYATLYYVRAYAINDQGTAYGSIRSFQTSYKASSATITTDPVQPSNGTWAKAGGYIKASEFPVIARGISWSTSPSPTQFSVNCGSDTGRFTCTLWELPANSRIYVRAYGVNNRNQVFYGNEVSFSTPVNPVKDTVYVSTLPVTSISATTAVSGGNITDANGHNVFYRGICWDKSPHPDIYPPDTTSNGSGIGSYSCTMTRLMPGTQYYLRAFAWTPEGVFYGNELTFTTATGPITPPNVSTTINQITDSIATISGRVFGNEGYLISERGLCWGISPDPLITSDKIIMGHDTGWYNYTFRGLTPGFTYYSRSYAIKYGQVIYGNTVSFIIGQNPKSTPVIFTNYVVPGSSGTTVTSQIIRSDLPMTDAGICWNDSVNPSITDAKISVTPAIGSFTVGIPGLVPGKTYSVRAYAVNSLGVGYGNIITFRIPPGN